MQTSILLWRKTIWFSLLTDKSFQFISFLPVFLTTRVSQMFYCLLKKTFYFHFFDVSIHQAKNVLISLLSCFR